MQCAPKQAVLQGLTVVAACVDLSPPGHPPAPRPGGPCLRRNCRPQHRRLPDPDEAEQERKAHVAHSKQARRSRHMQLAPVGLLLRGAGTHRPTPQTPTSPVAMWALTYPSSACTAAGRSIRHQRPGTVQVAGLQNCSPPSSEQSPPPDMVGSKRSKKSLFWGPLHPWGPLLLGGVGAINGRLCGPARGVATNAHKKSTNTHHMLALLLAAQGLGFAVRPAWLHFPLKWRTLGPLCMVWRSPGHFTACRRRTDLR